MKYIKLLLLLVFIGINAIPLYAQVNGTGGIAVLVAATPTPTPATPTPTPTPSGVTYFISPTGNDANAGTSSAAPWLSPNHPLNCGDIIQAAAGTYNEANFRIGRWGTVSCPANNNVAWLKCSTFDTCKINITTGSNDGMDPGKSYWGIQGWEVTSAGAANGSNNQCFNAFPGSGVNVHHVIFANNIANGCGSGGVTAGGSIGPGIDYIAMLGNISYDGARDPTHCYSGFDVLTPINTDTLAGTHIYIAGNFSWNNVDPNPCQGGLPTDGEGINLDTIDGNSFTQQIVVENNISVFNGGPGIMPFSNTKSPSSTIIVDHNTTYGNQTGAVNQFPCAELNINFSFSSQMTLNLAQTSGATSCRSAAYYALGTSGGNSTDSFTNNFIFSAVGNNTLDTTGGVVFTGNLTGTNPGFANPVLPPAPNCTGKTDVHDCASTIIANYTPANTTAKTYGYQQPSNISVHNTLYPSWLCSVTNMPPNLVTPGCI